MARLPPLEFRRLLRRTSTDAEHELWSRLRRHRMGPKFRRQHTVGPYTLDFYCPEARLAVELDGGQHYEGPQREKDVARDAWLEKGGDPRPSVLGPRHAAGGRGGRGGHLAGARGDRRPKALRR